MAKASSRMEETHENEISSLETPQGGTKNENQEATQDQPSRPSEEDDGNEKDTSLNGGVVEMAPADSLESAGDEDVTVNEEEPNAEVVEAKPEMENIQTQETETEAKESDKQELSVQEAESMDLTDVEPVMEESPENDPQKIEQEQVQEAKSETTENDTSEEDVSLTPTDTAEPSTDTADKHVDAEESVTPESLVQEADSIEQENNERVIEDSPERDPENIGQEQAPEEKPESTEKDSSEEDISSTPTDTSEPSTNALKGNSADAEASVSKEGSIQEAESGDQEDIMPVESEASEENPEEMLESQVTEETSNTDEDDTSEGDAASKPTDTVEPSTDVLDKKPTEKEEEKKEPVGLAKKVDTPPDVTEMTEKEEAGDEEKDSTKVSKDEVAPTDKIDDNKKSEIKSEPEKEIDQDFDHSHDFTNYTKEEIVELVKKLARYNDMIKAEKILKRLRSPMEVLHKAEKAEALKAFEKDGGEKADFSFRQDEGFERFDANSRLIRDRRQQYIKELEKIKEENLTKAEATLEKLRVFLDNSESSNTFKGFKDLQTEWKNIGQLPGAHYKTLWANYNALVSRFYDTRSIYFELKELDRRKNLEFKLHLCEKAEELEPLEDLKEAIILLNELHYEFKHTGPVPMVEQEPVWQRFKTASDKIYARRKQYNVVLKKELNENLKAKNEIADEIKTFVSFDTEKIKEWNTKTKEVLLLQKRWESVGGLPRDQAKEVNKQFWSSFKAYFHNKNQFFKKLEGQRGENLKLKEELVKQANELKESTDWEDTAKKMKGLQLKWKEIGPVPERSRNNIFSQFKEACDHFFDQRRSSHKGLEKDYVINLGKKKEIIAQINGLVQEDKSVDELKELQYQFYEVGFVPKAEVANIQSEYNDALNGFLTRVNNLTEQEREEIIFDNKIEKIRHSPNADKKIHQKEGNLRKQIGKIENDISIWRNNVEFFANSKNADKLKQDFNKKIDAASDEMERLKKQLRGYLSA